MLLSDKSVEVRDFLLDEHEVLVSEYQACLSAGVCRRPTLARLKCNTELGGHGDHPANCLTWEMLRDYCTWTEGRIPTVEEWEWAARGGANAFKHPWGSSAQGPASVCWRHRGTCSAKTHLDDRSVDGVWDLAGNVSEWTTDATGGHFRSGGAWLATYEQGSAHIHAQGDLAAHDPVRLKMGGRCAASTDPRLGGSGLL